MILYSLQCDNGHDFEGWFRDSAAFDDLARARGLSCPECGTEKVEKALMAPRLAKSEARDERKLSHVSGQDAALAQKLADLREHVEKNYTYVGPRFADEARRIHNSEDEPQQHIYGEATLKEAKELHDEGIPVAPLPFISKRDS